MRTKAIFLDALGTTVELEPPWVLLARELGTEPDRRLVAAVRSEMDYYKAHAHQGVDEASLAELRQSCAELLSSELGRPVSVPQMMASIRFRAFPDALPALDGLRRRGLALVCVSNWDMSLVQVLERCGLGAAFDGVVSSALSGHRKPDPRIFGPALELAGCTPEEALHVGDTREEDAQAAAAAGIRCLLIDRAGGGQIASLAEIEQHLDR
jgi:putative hydrolase of the HAD superfamily